VNSEVFIAGQIDESTLPQIKECGIKSVLARSQFKNNYFAEM